MIIIVIIVPIAIITILDTIGFSQNLYTVYEDEGMIGISIFSFTSAVPVENLTIYFTTYNINATSGN